MPRLTRIYTRTGDDGTTGLGIGSRVPKDSLRVAAYGTVDELNAFVGVARAADVDGEIGDALATIQNDLFHLGSALCMPPAERGDIEIPEIEKRHVEQLEAWIDRWNDELPSLTNFVLPAGTAAAAHLHVARTVCRRAERRLVTLGRDDHVDPEALHYLNRLSDLLFVLSRVENLRAGVEEVLWDSRA